VDAAAWDERYRSSPLVWSAEPNVWLAEEAARLTPGRAIDLAAGEGRNALWLVERGFTVEAVDFSPVAIDKARTRADERGVALATTVADVTAPLDIETADLVLVCYLQLDRASLALAHAEAARLTRPGGTLLVIAHARANLERGVGGPPDPAVLPTVDEVVGDLAGTGLVIERAEEVVRAVETDEGVREAIDLVVRAVRPSA
jgi:SAM-dependent methyltransferase